MSGLTRTVSPLYNAQAIAIEKSRAILVAHTGNQRIGSSMSQRLKIIDYFSSWTNVLARNRGAGGGGPKRNPRGDSPRWRDSRGVRVQKS